MKKSRQKKARDAYVSFEYLTRRLKQDKEAQKAYAADQLEHEMVRALIRARIMRKLSQAQVAKRAGMHQSAVARLETGTSNPRIGTLTRVAAALEVKHMYMK